MRGTGSVREDDRIYLGSLSNSYRFDALGWTPIPLTGSSPRVFDLSGQLDLVLGGQLNVAVQDDVGIDWVVLNLQVVSSAGGSPGIRTIRGPRPGAEVPLEASLTGMLAQNAMAVPPMGNSERLTATPTFLIGRPDSSLSGMETATSERTGTEDHAAITFIPGRSSLHWDDGSSLTDLTFAGDPRDDALLFP
jgi:hypothetical protein